MYFVVANLVHQHDWPTLAAAQFGHKVVQALLDTGRDRAMTQGTDRRVFHGR